MPCRCRKSESMTFALRMGNFTTTVSGNLFIQGLIRSCPGKQLQAFVSVVELLHPYM